VVITITIDFRKKVVITVIYTYNMFVLFCACDVVNMANIVSVKKKMKNYKKKY
jgi:hypothetical protein